MEILIINSGSSSLKYQLIDSKEGVSKVKGLVDRIGIDGSTIKYVALKNGKETEIKKQLPIRNHEEAMKQVTDLLTDTEVGVISNPDDIKAVGHRVVHGGEKFVQPTLINEEVKKEIEKLIPLSPLHNPEKGRRSACLRPGSRLQGKHHDRHSGRSRAWLRSQQGKAQCTPKAPEPPGRLEHGQELGAAEGRGRPPGTPWGDLPPGAGRRGRPPPGGARQRSRV